MGIRNCAEVGENLQKIVKRLLANDELIKLLYYTDKDPLSNVNLTDEQKQKEIFEKLIKVVPRVGPKENAKSIVVISVLKGSTNAENSEFRNIHIRVEVFVPLTQWLMKDSNLRPFAILGEVQKSLSGKTINGLGKMVGGDFEVNFFSEEISCYTQHFYLTTYE